MHTSLKASGSTLRAPTPKARAAVLSGFRLDRQKIEVAARPLAGRIIKSLEDLVASGFEPNGSSMVPYSGSFFRDLAPVTLDRTLALVAPMSGTGVSPARGRRPLTPTPVQELAQAARQMAAATVKNSFSINFHLRRQAERLAANPAISRLYIAGREALQRRAADALALDVRRFDHARDAEHRAHGLPALRPRIENQSLHRTKEGHRRWPRFWDTHKGVIAAHEAPKSLHDLGETGFIYFAALAAACSIPGRVLAATVNLTDDTDRRARKSGKPASWMLERVTRQLKKALGRAVPVVVAMEINKAKLLHAHLIIAGILPGEREAVKAALKAAGGKSYRGKQVVVRGPQPDSGWCSYMSEDFIEAWPWASRVAATADLRAAAEVAFREVMTFIADPDKLIEDKSGLTYCANGAGNADEAEKILCALPDVDVDPRLEHKDIKCITLACPAMTSQTCSRRPTSSTSTTPAQPRSSCSGTRSSGSWWWSTTSMQAPRWFRPSRSSPHFGPVRSGEDSAPIILAVHDPLPGKTGWPCDLALLAKWHTSPAPTAVKSLSGQIIGHLDAPIAGPPTGTTVMMTFAEKVDDVNGKPGYGWRYAD